MNELIAEFMANFRSPVALLRTTWPSLYRAAKRMKFEDDDIEQLCWLGVIMAAKDFRPDGGASFAIFATIKMRGIVTNQLQRLFASKRFLPDGVWMEGWGTLCKVPQPEGSIGSELPADIAQAMKNVGPRRKKVLERRFGLDGDGGRTQLELAVEWGVSRQRIHQLEYRAIEMIRQEIRK